MALRVCLNLIATLSSSSRSLLILGQEVVVHIQSETVFGARHALETLTQFVEPYQVRNSSTGLLLLAGFKVSDEPYYHYRGLMIDTSVTFLSIKDIQEQIEAMALSKMNVLHWHITGRKSFRFETPSRRKMNA